MAIIVAATGLIDFCGRHKCHKCWHTK